MNYSDLIIESANIAKNIPYIHRLKYDYFEKEIKENEEGQYNCRKGKYISIIPKDINNKSLLKILSSSILKLLPNKVSNLFVVGLGNPAYISDSLGSLVIKKLTPSNIIQTFTPNVFSTTGIESFDLIKAISKHIKPSCVILIDSIVTSSPKKLCNCFQITTAGISPGSGLNLNKKIISSETINFPTIAIGFPTILSFKNKLYSLYNCEDVLENSSKLIADAINKISAI